MGGAAVEDADDGAQQGGARLVVEGDDNGGLRQRGRASLRPVLRLAGPAPREQRYKSPEGSL